MKTEESQRRVPVGHRVVLTDDEVDWVLVRAAREYEDPTARLILAKLVSFRKAPLR